MKAVISLSNRLMQRYLPDPYLFVIILTLAVFFLGLIFTPSTPLQMVEFWGGGFWGLLSFAMQMVLVLVTGHVLASSPLFKKGLSAMASAARTPGQAIVYVTAVSMIASFINWGFGLVIGALFAKELAKKVTNVDYRLLIASAYSGFVIWHGGISGSVPLTIATEGHFAQDLIGLIPTSETIFAPFNLIIVAVLFIALPLVNRLMMPGKEETISIDPALLNETGAEAASLEFASHTPAEKAENSKIISMVIGIMGLIYLISYFMKNGFLLNLDVVNFMFLFLGILFHGTPRNFLNAVAEAIKGTSGIIIQFPFYAGIMGMMVTSGLAAVISEGFVSISNQQTFPVLAFWSAGLVNIFVPSGGGQWAVQAPVMIEAAKALDVSMPKTAMAVAWGDAWTNMIQPFWALPALAIAGLKAKDIMGYCVFVLLISGVIISLGFFFL
ncbi:MULTISPECIES: short-chain fatty acid transporter [Metabacillus]|uniref:Short-chain fatty acid transporter n=1 Tax=Metabacillus indicus TaxID=246786 RepID=A0A084H2W2_METID|nr:MULTISPECIES: short-chain fatty acid transporter [Metabacillus]KEZ52712.1 short-chain fatty acid transporter [Metabacillus indicus LMG 22858]KEZ53924.1 short-chain fatty acid transporter [Metabacillus indicus]